MQTVVETRPFSRRADELLQPEERLDLIAYLAANPLAGDVIVGTGGIPKLRWRAKGKGKSGGVRVIYYTYDEAQPIFALLIYGKNEADDLTADERRTLSKIASDIKSADKARGARGVIRKWRRKP